MNMHVKTAFLEISSTYEVHQYLVNPDTTVDEGITTMTALALRRPLVFNELLCLLAGVICHQVQDTRHDAKRRNTESELWFVSVPADFPALSMPSYYDSKAKAHLEAIKNYQLLELFFDTYACETA